MGKIKLPKKERPKGLFLYCNNCDKQYSNDSLVKCKCDDLVYKARIHVPGTKKGSKSKVLESKTLVDAFKEFKEYKKELISNSFQKIQIKKEKFNPTMLLECFAYYMGFLNNVDVPKHKHRQRSDKAISAYDLDFRLYKEALDSNKIDSSILKFTDVNDEMVGFLHEYLLIDKRYANKTYNNVMSNLSAFTTHMITKFRFDYANPFLGVEKLNVNTKNLSVYEDEFNKLLEVTTYDNGYKIIQRPKRKTNYRTNVFKSWLKHGFLIGLYTGGRSEEIVNLKWSNITLHENGNFNCINVIHYKLNKAKGHLVSEKDSLIKEFTITKELGALLIEMGYEENKNKNQFILAQDRESRTQVGNELSQAFSHYYTQLKTGKEITFKNLRKTFITSAYNQYGDASIALTDHADTAIIKKNYYNKQVTKEDAQNEFQVFKSQKKDG